jgi:hypothetical protein
VTWARPLWELRKAGAERHRRVAPAIPWLARFADKERGVTNPKKMREFEDEGEGENRLCLRTGKAVAWIVRQIGSIFAVVHFHEETQDILSL